MYRLILGVTLVIGNVFFAEVKADIKLNNLKVEYETTPLGIDVEKPRFSWQMVADNLRGCYQDAYQIIVSSELNDTVWDSGKINSGESLNICYSGLSLKPTTKYHWTVKVRDQKGEQHSSDSWFETGLMNADIHSSVWSGAQWIGGKDPVLFAHYLPAYKINYTLRLDKSTNTTKAGFIYGANDIRLMDKNKNTYHIESRKDSSYLLIEIDITKVESGNNAALNIYRVGYYPKDRKDIPYKKYDIPNNIINRNNRYNSHTIYIHSTMGYTHIYVDGDESANLIAEVNLNPLGQGGDFIAFPVTGDIGFKVPPKMTAYFSDIEVRNYRSPSNILFAEQNSRKIVGGKNGKLLTTNIDRNSMPMLRTDFNTDTQQIKKARLYVTSRGIYEIYINGTRIGEDYFNPGLSQYNKTHFYQTFDVTPHISSGKNAMGAILGEGWWSGGATFMDNYWNFFGDRQSLLAKLVVTYSDGREDVIITRPDSWKYYNDGPIVYGSFFQGEVYDAAKEDKIRNWNLPHYNDKSWVKATRIPLSGNISRDNTNKVHNMPMVDDYSEMRMIGNIGPSPRKVKELTATSVKKIHPGVYVYDMGQNMVGVPKIKLSGNEPGKTIIMRFAEVLYPDLPEYKENTGTLMLENIRAAMAQDIYITKGGEEIVNPRFTFHGYRYLEITGIPAPLPLEDVKGEVISSVYDLTSHYETSDEKINKLWENITWSTYGNFLSIPTDCQQLNERLGWSGDISVFSRTATYLADVPQFLNRHIRAMRDVQREDGRFSDIAPLGGGFGGILWGSAGITVAWESYQQYNDKQLLVDHYDAMKNYIEYILSKNIDHKTGLLVQEKPGDWGNLGDWLGPEDGKNDKTLLWEAYFIYDLQLMEKIAAVLEKTDDQIRFKNLLNSRKTFFNDTYIDPNTCKTVYSDYNQYSNNEAKKGQLIDTQTSYVLPLAFDIIREEFKDKVVENLIETIVRDNVSDDGTQCPPFSLMTGFIGTAWINNALSKYGHSDAAYQLLQQKTYPSWLYSVEQGATTIWERLNSYTHTDGFGGNNRMNSFNHYSFGAIGAWMHTNSLGIVRDENSPGFKHFILQPEPDPGKQITYSKGYYDSMYGRIESCWELKDGVYYYTFTIPANTSATLYLSSSSRENITESGVPISEIEEEVKYLGCERKKHIFELKSGKYAFKTN